MSEWWAFVPVVLGIAASPILLVQFLLVLTSERASRNTPVFIAVLVLASYAVVAVAAVLTIAALDQAGDAGDPATSTVAIVINAALVLLLIALTIRSVRKRGEPADSAMIDAIAGMRPRAVAGLALATALLNPKSVPLLLAGGELIAINNSGGIVAALSAAAVFVVACYALIIVIAAVYAATGGAGAAQIERAQAWLILRQHEVLIVVFGVLAIWLGAGVVEAITSR
jgi:hypothetical protein